MREKPPTRRSTLVSGSISLLAGLVLPGEDFAASPKVKALSTRLEQIPPYGFAPLEFAEAPPLTDQPYAISLQGANPAIANYISACKAEIAKHVWPRYDPISAQWVGAAGTDAVEVSRDDIDLIVQVRPLLQNTISSFSTAPAKHFGLFRAEDNLAGEDNCGVSLGAFHSGRTLLEYTAGVQDGPAIALAALMSHGDHRRPIATALANLKHQFQRPRPHQMAYLLGRANFTCVRAKTSFTPSLPSGHCLEALASGAVAYSTLLHSLTPELKGAFSQYLVDIGDRRVFAGVHYATDNVASWYCSLLFCDLLSSTSATETRAFIWSAIREKSAVYRTLVKFSTHSRAIEARIRWLHAHVRAFGLPVE
jgi:PAP2 superfamily